jgi:ABC-2 type transport system ATP-binding protein
LPIESDSLAVVFRSVTKRFHIQESTSLKEFLPALLSRRDWLAAPFAALKDVSFLVKEGETLGIIGANGSGKSTVLKLAAGIMEPNEGEITVSGRVCPIIELGTGFHPDLTGRENVFLNASLLGLSGQETRERLPQIVEFSGISPFIDTPVKRYSSGMYVRLAFAIAVHTEPDILLVDEALAVGDADFQEKCLDRMRELQANGTTIVLVSHNLKLIQEYCTRAILLNKGRLEADGPPRAVVEAYELGRHRPGEAPRTRVAAP